MESRIVPSTTVGGGAPFVLVLGEDEAIGNGILAALSPTPGMSIEFRKQGYSDYLHDKHLSPASILIVSARDISLGCEKTVASLNLRMPRLILRGPGDLGGMPVLLAQRAVAAYVDERQDLGLLRQSVKQVASLVEREEFGRPRAAAGRIGRALQVPIAASIEFCAGLSQRETETIREFARGYSMKEIGKRLGISPKTAETYKRRAMQKLACTTRAELLAGDRLLGLAPAAGSNSIMP